MSYNPPCKVLHEAHDVVKRSIKNDSKKTPYENLKAWLYKKKAIPHSKEVLDDIFLKTVGTKDSCLNK